MRTTLDTLSLLALGALAPVPAAAQGITRVRTDAASGIVAVERVASIALYDRTTAGEARIRVDTPNPRVVVWGGGLLAVPVQGAVRIVDVATGATRTTIPQTAAPRALALDARGRRLLVQAANGVARVHELPSGRALAEIPGVHCAGLTSEGEVVTADDRSVQRRASPEAPPQIVALRGARASAMCTVVRGGTLLVASASGVFWAYDAATGRSVLGSTAARGDPLVSFLDALEGGAPVVPLPGSSWRVASSLDLRVGRRVDARYATPRCVPTEDARCPPPSHTYIVDAAARGDSVVALGVRDIDDEYGYDTLFLVEGTGAVRVIADRVPESSRDALSPDGAWVARLILRPTAALELTPTAGGEPRRAPCADRQLAFAPDGRALVTWSGDAATLWRLDEPALAPVRLR